MSTMASQIIGVLIVCSAVCLGTDQRKHQRPASLTFVTGLHQGPVDCPLKEPVTQKMFPFDCVIMKIFTTPPLYICSYLLEIIFLWVANVGKLLFYHNYLYMSKWNMQSLPLHFCYTIASFMLTQPVSRYQASPCVLYDVKVANGWKYMSFHPKCAQISNAIVTRIACRHHDCSIVFCSICSDQ